MPQINYSNQKRAQRGMPVTAYNMVMSAINDDPRAAQVVEFVVDTAATSGVITINGVSFTGAGADEDAVAAALATAVNAEGLVNGVVVAESATDTVTVTARIGGVGFTYADGTATTATETQANAAAAALKFGVPVVATGISDGTMLIKQLDSATVADVVGIAQGTYANQVIDDDGAASPGSAVNVAYRGDVWVAVEGAVAIGDDVYVRHNTTAGTFATGAGTGLVELPNARWIAPSEDGLAGLRFHFD